MLGINTVKNWINRDNNNREINQNIRAGLNDLIQDTKQATAGQSHFFDMQPFYTTSGIGNIIGLTDQAVSSKDLYELMERDSYISALYDQLVSVITKNGWRFGGSVGLARAYSNKLESIKIDDLIASVIAARWADGGGNFLSHTVKAGRDLEVRVEPFLAEGFSRVAVYGDNKNRKVTGYEIIDSFTQRPIYSFNSETDYIFHGRYSQRGDFRFSSNPAKKAVFWYILKKTIAGMTLSSFQNGLQDPTIMSLDYDGLAKLATAFSTQNNKVGGSVAGNFSKEFSTDPIKFFRDQAEITKSIIADELTGPGNANKAIMTKVPVTVTKVGRDNKSMETIPLLQVCDEEMGYAFRMSKGIINTKDSKYSNAEVESDNFQSLVVEPEQKYIADWVMNWVMPIFFSNYDKEKNPFIFGVDPDAEDLQSYELMTNRTKSQSEIIAALVGTGYELDLEKNEIIKVGEPTLSTPPDKSGNQEVGKSGPENVVDNTKDASAVNVEKKKSRGVIRAVQNVAPSGCVMAMLDPSEFASLLTEIAYTDTYTTNESYASGKVTDQHITLLYGLEKTVTTQIIQEKLDGTFDDTEIFLDHLTVFKPEGKEYEVLVIECKPTDNILEANSILRDLPYQNNHPDYKPHVTLAYLKKGEGDKYLENIDLPKQSFRIQKIVFSPDGSSDSETVMDFTKTDESTRAFLDKAIDGKNAKKFESIIRNATTDQLNFYTKKLAKYDTLEEAIKNVQKDLPSITSSGLPVNTMKAQLMKFAKVGMVEFEATHKKRSYSRATEYEYEYPPELVELFDTKSQVLLKGWDSLDEDQRAIMDKFWSSRPYDGYQGLDAELSSEVNTILKRSLDAGLGIAEAVKEMQVLTPERAEWRALRIAKTESAQAIEVTRYQLYTSNGYKWKKRVTVNDDRVRDRHRDDREEGWIPIADSFKASGEQGPHDAVNCRCNLRYSDSVKKPD
jgi:2'-5' RNA ligase